MKKNIFDSIKFLNLQNNLITISPSTNWEFSQRPRETISPQALTLCGHLQDQIKVNKRLAMT